MMKPVKFMSQWGKEYKVVFVKNTYANNGQLYIGCLNEDEDYGGWEPYCDITVNLNAALIGENYGYIDVNNGDPKLFALMKRKGWIAETGFYGGSGFCSYPMVEFSEEFLKMLDAN